MVRVYADIGRSIVCPGERGELPMLGEIRKIWLGWLSLFRFVFYVIVLKEIKCVTF